MEQKDRTEGLRALIRQGLQAVAHKDTLTHLGDRPSYAGMSDIGQHWECPRATLARKVLPTTNSLERLLTAFRTGHISLTHVDYAQGFYPLCSYCEYNGDCPKFPQGIQMPQWEPALEKLAASRNSALPWIMKSKKWRQYLSWFTARLAHGIG